jgi:hypothetical protein
MGLINYQPLPFGLSDLTRTSREWTARLNEATESVIHLTTIAATLENNETLNTMINDLIEENDPEEAALWESIGWTIEDTTDELTLDP